MLWLDSEYMACSLSAFFFNRRGVRPVLILFVKQEIDICTVDISS